MTTTYQPTIPAKRELIAAEASIFESRPDDWDVFAITVVFSAGYWSPNAPKYESLFRTQVLKKLQRQISRKDDCIPYVNFRYEFSESSRYRSVADQRKPHHIHGTLAIPKASTKKIWNVEQKTLQPRMVKDFGTIEDISSILLEPVREGEIGSWLGYMMKEKSFDD